LNKTQREYANSFLEGSEDVYSGGLKDGRKDGNWVNPDNTARTVTEGGTSCDLTGQDWGIGYDTGGEVKKH